MIHPEYAPFAFSAVVHSGRLCRHANLARFKHPFPNHLQLIHVDVDRNFFYKQTFVLLIHSIFLRVVSHISHLQRNSNRLIYRGVVTLV